MRTLNVHMMILSFAAQCVLSSAEVIAQIARAPKLEILERVEGFTGHMFPRGINNLGEITGLALMIRGGTGGLPFVSDAMGTTVYSVPAPSGWSNARAEGINDAGQLAVTAFGSGGGEFLSFRYTPGMGYEEIGTLGGSRSATQGINESGVVVGWNDSPQLAYRYSDGVLEDLGVPPGRTLSAAHAVNDVGQVAGTAVGSSQERAFRYTDGDGFQELGFIPGFPHNSAAGINDAGDVVGRMLDNGGGNPTPFLWTASGGMVALPKLAPDRPALAFDINNHGWIVGLSQRSDRVEVAVLWIDGEIIDLEALLGGSVRLADAIAVNDYGQITGIAIINNEMLAYRLTIITRCSPNG